MVENGLRIIGYGVLFVINALWFYFLHSHFNFTIMVMMIGAPVLSAMINFTLRRYINVEVYEGADADSLKLSGKTKVRKSGNFKQRKNGGGSSNLLTAGSTAGAYTTQGEESFVTIKIKNPTPFPCLDAILRMEITNTFFESKGEKNLTVPIRAAEGLTLTLPIISDYPGIIGVTVKEIRLKDLMGFFRLKKTFNSTVEITVMPQLIGEVAADKSSLNQGMLESEESSKRGNDFSDVQEIREYIPGDKLMSIHWKLSAKRDILMVKDRVSMSDRQMVVLPELCNQSAPDLSAVLSMTYTLIVQLIADKTTVRLMYWSADRYEYQDTRIDYREELDAAFAEMFYEHTYEADDEAASHMADVHPEMKAYLHIYAEGGMPQLQIRENV
jgi:hypothetical protein